MTLAELKTGQKVQVSALDTDPVTQERLRAIGFGRGRILTLLQKDPHRPLLVGFYGTDSRIALGLELAQVIRVTFLEHR
ncbi:MAG: hypothetical protein A2600_11130 [Candidatus Lambdaproteobacteria bacterium RIFOXYD1_FULL_56_27]|uniref:Ferrous iron transporter FeoA-like domain-containing protein n=1 Tax=Candidatus Lambdaproteobacteria bacterium RIFOXYD2_FULL_56_26 TaxID=1817773 RepID=A0A1F6GU84_9PROT|nr:MAG: hypothetical protein A2426_09170 [Candidatus Lambdaproteobacteria bacterium RIFOXYC1_FULL_56_13]OGH01713.1 MAG: hypothetical protein A2557_09055 [Candidatus Lambdaproteobacteria bacterium RIFOXYD2_FULL_56_26]OGH07598.1 MAG: hypothetical protein A2600_11130 [Candidatus Lambdaproteobacteria bacterium RIFOXYD1_FULL_56_27]